MGVGNHRDAHEGKSARIQALKRLENRDTASTAPGRRFDKKSIRVFATDPNKWSWRDLAADCVAFANAQGGQILFGVEDDAVEPPREQRIDPPLIDRLRKGIAQHTHNVAVTAEVRSGANGGQFLALRILPNLKSIAATADARYFVRIADETRRLYPEDLVRLVAEKDSYQWETQLVRRVSCQQADPAKTARFLHDIRASERVKDAVKQRSDLEVLEHYLLVTEGCASRDRVQRTHHAESDRATSPG